MNRAPPFVAIGMLLVPVLYVGSYLALATPGWIETDEHGAFIRARNYRCVDSVAIAFWPLEQVDRRVRPDAWDVRGQIIEMNLGIGG